MNLEKQSENQLHCRVHLPGVTDLFVVEFFHGLTQKVHGRCVCSYARSYFYGTI